jgi:hypothetical protein
MPNQKTQKVPMSEREWRRRYVQMLQVEVGLLDPPDASGRLRRPAPKSAAARRRVVEILYAEMGERAPWDRPAAEDPRRTRGKSELIDDTPWREARQASLRAQHQRLGRHGLAFAHDGTIRCVKCRDVVLAIPRGRPHAIGAPISALAMRHRHECTG